MRLIFFLIVVVCCVADVTAEKNDGNKEKSCENEDKNSQKDGRDEHLKERHAAKDDQEEKKDNNSRERRNKKINDDDIKHDEENITTSDFHCVEPQVCPDACPFYVDPFCALPDGWCAEPQTFSNPCFLAVYNCKNPKQQYKFFHDGGCFTTTPAPGQDCGVIDCIFNYTPICALPDGFCAEPMTFSNLCNMEVHNCFNPNEKYTYFHDGECLTTPAPEPNCATISGLNDNKPICGLPDGFCGKSKTFTKYKFFHEGQCLVVSIPEPKPQCDIICLDSYNPICTLPDDFCGEPRTFGNECSLNAYNCRNKNQKYKKFHDGECLTTTTPAPEPNCAAISCLNDNKPICSLPDGFCGKPETFSNGCNMNVHNCFNPNQKYKYFHEGKCKTTPVEPCNTMCPAIYDPVCAIPDGFCGEPKTYSSSCVLNSENCVSPNQKYKYFHMGECKTKPEEQCNIMCPAIYKPVCALPDGFCGQPKTYSSSCVLNSENCVSPNQKYKYFHEGECKAKPEEQCNTMCPAIYDPVCTLPDGFCGQPKTYSSSCVLNSENCLRPNQKYKYFHDGECIPQPPVCPTICPDNYEPLCATGPSGDLMRFSNKCDFESHNCLNTNNQYTYAYDGECKICSDIKCNKIYQPVCASNSKNILTTFENPCQLQWNNCENPNDQYNLLYDGECQPQCSKPCTKKYLPVCAKSCNGTI